MRVLFEMLFLVMMGLGICAIVLGIVRFAVRLVIYNMSLLINLVRRPDYGKALIVGPWLGLFVYGFTAAAVSSCSVH